MRGRLTDGRRGDAEILSNEVDLPAVRLQAPRFVCAARRVTRGCVYLGLGVLALLSVSDRRFSFRAGARPNRLRLAHACHRQVVGRALRPSLRFWAGRRRAREHGPRADAHRRGLDGEVRRPNDHSGAASRSFPSICLPCCSAGSSCADWKCWIWSCASRLCPMVTSPSRRGRPRRTPFRSIRGLRAPDAERPGQPRRRGR